MKKLKNIHPGEILLIEFMEPIRLSQNKLANDIGVPPRRINEIVNEKRSVTADTDLRLSKYFGTSDGYWLRLQMDFDLEEQRKEVQQILRKIKPFSLSMHSATHNSHGIAS